MRVWALDRVGYDTRGGQARVFSSLEAAKAAVDWVEWEQDADGSWMEKHDPRDLRDIWVIDVQEVLGE